MVKDIATIFLFVSEVFNTWGHFAVLFRIRRLPREDLAARKYYFMMEVALMVAMLCFTDQADTFTLNILDIFAHSYYILFWESTEFSKKVMIIQTFKRLGRGPGTCNLRPTG